MVSIIRILFVCARNISLSPMAVQIFKHITKKKKVFERFSVDSASVLNVSVGQPLVEGCQVWLEKAGIDIGSHTSAPITENMAENYDWIVCMSEVDRRMCFDIFKDNAVYVTPKDVRYVFRADPASPISLNGKVKARVCCLMDFSGNPHDVADPLVTNNYRTAFNEVTLGCTSILSLAMKNTVS